MTIRRVISIVMVMVFTINDSMAISQSVDYKIKAALVYKLTRFVTWPAKALGKGGAAFNICIVGDDPFGKLIDALATKRIKSHPILIKRMPHYTQENCHVLFITVAKKRSYPAILAILNNKSILTISDIADFAKYGGMIQIYKNKKRFSFIINNKKAKKQG